MPYMRTDASEPVVAAAATEPLADMLPSFESQNFCNATRQDLYLEFTPLIRRLMSRYGTTQEFRNDLVGTLYCRFCALIDAYDPERGVPLKPYLVQQLSIAAYEFARSHWRLQRREVFWDSDEGSIAHPAIGEDPTAIWDENLYREQLAVRLSAAIAQLPQRQRQVIVWRYFDGCSFEEIATRLGVQSSTARSLMRHGLVALRLRILPGQD